MLLFRPGLVMATAAASATATTAAAALANPGHVGGLLAVGNPLLDIVASVDANFLKEFKLTPGDGVLQTPDQDGIYERIVEEFAPTYLPGGSALNSARTFQAVGDQPRSTTYLGAVGEDDAGKLLEELATKEGVDMRLQKVADAPTGKCAVLVHNKERTLCTNLGASSKLSFTEDIEGLADGTDICYMTTYVLQSSKEDAADFLHSVTNVELYDACTFGIAGVRKVVSYQFAKRCTEASKVVGLNLSSSFSVAAHKNTLKELLPNVNIVFGNNEEYTELVTGLGLIGPYDGTFSDKDEYEQRVCKMVLGLMMAPAVDTAGTTAGTPATSQKVLKAAVMTRQKNPVYIAEASTGGEVSFQMVPVPPVPEHEIVDVNGAGDAFVGGFFAAFTKGHSLSKAALLGSLAAGQIIRCEGFCVDLNKLRGLMSDERFCQEQSRA